MTEDTSLAAFRGAMTADPGADTSDMDMGGDAGGDPPSSLERSEASQALRETVEGAQQQAERVPAGDAQMPEWRQRERQEERARERQEREQERRELAELREFKRQQEQQRQQPQEAPDFFSDEKGWRDSLKREALEEAKELARQEYQELRQRERVEDSLAEAVEKHGQEAVDQAGQRFAEICQRDPRGMEATYRQIMGSRSPYAALLKWDREHQERQTIGDDGLDAFLEKQKAAWLAEMNGEAPPSNPSGAAPSAETAPRRVTEPPQPARRSLPSLNRAAGSQDGDEPEDPVDAFRAAMRPAR